MTPETEIQIKLAKIQSGIEGVHRRQDIANGRTAKLENKVSVLEKEDIRIAGAIGSIEAYIKKQDAKEAKMGARAWSVAQPFVIVILIALWLTIRENIKF